MKELDQLRNLMETINDYGNERAWHNVFVYDSYEDEISEYNLRDELQYARFDDKYGFDSSSLFDFPIENGVRHFTNHDVNPPKEVIVSPDMQSLAAAVEAESQT